LRSKYSRADAARPEILGFLAPRRAQGPEYRLVPLPELFGGKTVALGSPTLHAETCGDRAHASAYLKVRAHGESLDHAGPERVTSAGGIGKT